MGRIYPRAITASTDSPLVAAATRHTPRCSNTKTTVLEQVVGEIASEIDYRLSEGLDCE
jgi:hypothetical protein